MYEKNKRCWLIHESRIICVSARHWQNNGVVQSEVEDLADVDQAASTAGGGGPFLASAWSVTGAHGASGCVAGTAMAG
jgi:hypothetical protein